VDLAILPAAANLERFKSAMKELNAHCIAVPPLEEDYLLRGHAVHFRCQHPDAKKSVWTSWRGFRGMDDFAGTLERRTTLTSADGTPYELLSPDDLVQAKKTQRDKDWVMLRASGRSVLFSKSRIRRQRTKSDFG